MISRTVPKQRSKDKLKNHEQTNSPTYLKNSRSEAGNNAIG